MPLDASAGREGMHRTLVLLVVGLPAGLDVGHGIAEENGQLVASGT